MGARGAVGCTGVHADNSHAPCGLNHTHCIKEWHHNWVHDCEAKCMRGDDYTKNLSMHHNVTVHRIPYPIDVPRSPGAV
jgi:hypothetical protein